MGWFGRKSVAVDDVPLLVYAGAMETIKDALRDRGLDLDNDHVLRKINFEISLATQTNWTCWLGR